MAAIRCISIWQPYASLLVRGFKMNETRPFPAPSTIVGQRIGIASTKQIRPEQIESFNDPDFQRHYVETGLPTLMELPHGYLLGTVLINSSDPITQDDLEDITEEEALYGWWEPGRYAWRCRAPEIFPEPIKIQGKQGIWIHDTEAGNVVSLR